MNRLDLTPYDALLLDFDNTLLATEEFHVMGFTKALKQLLDYDLTREDEIGYMGRTTTSMSAMIIDRLGRHDVTPEQVTELKRQLVLEVFEPKVYPGVVEFLSRQKGKRVIAVVSNSPRDFIDHAMSLSGLTPYVDALLTCDDVVRCKPDPEIFLKASSRVGVPVPRCLVFEDSEIGLQASLSGGFASVLVLNPDNIVPRTIPTSVHLTTWLHLLEGLC